MSSRADYRCSVCGHEQECVFDGMPAYTQTVNHATPSTGEPCPGQLIRVWTPVAVGRVQGAGGSPAR